MTRLSQINPPAAQRWRAMVEAEHAQSEGARESGTPPQDHWAAVAERFREEYARFTGASKPGIRRL